MVLCVAAAASGLTLPQAGRNKRQAGAADQQADPSLMLYSAVMPSTIGLSRLDISAIHAPLLLRKRRDVSEQDQQAEPTLLMYSALPAAVDVSSIGLKTVPLSSVAVSNIHSPLFWRKKRDTADQQAEDATILYSMAMPLTNNIWGMNNAFVVPLLKK